VQGAPPPALRGVAAVYGRGIRKGGSGISACVSKERTPVKICIFAVGSDGQAGGSDELNTFLGTHRVLSVEKALVSNPGGGAYWSFVVSYLDGPASAASRSHGGEHGSTGDRTDYKQTLSELDFALFVKLRELRKRIALDEGVPMYMVFTNAQLAEMAQARCESKASLKKIDGVGDARVDKYAERFLAEIAGHAQGGSIAGENSGTGKPAPSVLEGGSAKA
jgi:hypothetical protein